MMQNNAKAMLILITNSSIAPRETDTPIMIFKEPVTLSLVVVQHVVTAEERASLKIVVLVVDSKNKINYRSVLQCMKMFSKCMAEKDKKNILDLLLMHTLAVYNT